MSDPFQNAIQSFAVALLGLLGMLLVIAFATDGPTAVARIAGLAGGEAPIHTLRLAAAADTLLPIGYAAGLCLMAIGLATDGTGRLVAMAVIPLVLFGAGLDFLENGAALQGRPVPGLTIGKYGVISIAALILSGRLPPQTPWLRVTRLAVRWGLPLFMAALATGLPLFTASTPFVLALAALIGLVMRAARDARHVVLKGQGP